MPVDSITPDSGRAMCMVPPLPRLAADAAAQDLAEDLDERHALADEVVQAAVGGDQLVVGAQADTQGGGDGLLAARRPVDALDLAGGDPLGSAGRRPPSSRS